MAQHLSQMSVWFYCKSLSQSKVWSLNFKCQKNISTIITPSSASLSASLDGCDFKLAWRQLHRATVAYCGFKLAWSQIAQGIWWEFGGWNLRPAAGAHCHHVLMSINVLRRKGTVRRPVIQTLACPVWKSKPGRGGQCSGGDCGGMYRFLLLARLIFCCAAFCAQACGSHIQAPGKLEGNCRRSVRAQFLLPKWAGPESYQKSSPKQVCFWMQMLARVQYSDFEAWCHYF